nr:hypothetical protein [Armatimonadota bacterium]
MPLPFPYPTPYPTTPTATYALPAAFTGPVGPPVVYSHTTSAGPDESFFLAGAGLGKSLMLWGPGSGGGGGAAATTLPMIDPDHLVGTVSQAASDGVYVGVAGDGDHWSNPFRLNAPQPWWCGPDRAAPDGLVDLVGDELAERPDRVRAWVYAALPGKPGAWASTAAVSRYRVRFHAPAAPGHYNVWVYGGSGGQYGWGGPVPLDVASPARTDLRRVEPQAFTAAGIEGAMD